MTISQAGKRAQRMRVEPPSKRPQTATWVMGLLIGLGGSIGAAWMLGQPTITQGFARLNQWQQHPPLGLEVMLRDPDLLFAPTIGVLLVVFGVMHLSPKPQPWSRWIVATILLALTTRYLLWRSLSSLNLSTPLNGVFSLGLLGFELLMITASVLQFLLLFRRRDRRHDADVLSQDVLSGRYLPSVDVLIPTYDEPAFILRRTVIGCQAMDYPHKTVYLLDDTRRPEIRALAQELGCRYLTRPDNRFAKAGNLNHAIAQSDGELIAIFDADFVPTKNFLTRTLGFFQQPDVALVQTPQSFYNADPIARNLGLETVLTPEEEVFYRHIQPLRDGVGGVICAGTSFVVRRSALRDVGGFVTDSLSEDYFTGIQLAAAGYHLIYLDEKLSAGLAAENMAAHAMQRIRWAQGTLQAFFIASNPLTIPGLSLMQRLAHLEGLLNWFTVLSRTVFLFMPLAYAFFGIIPLQTNAAELAYFFLPYYLVQLCVFSWLNGRSRSALLSDVYSVVLCFPLAAVVIRSMLRPFSKGFNVTPKGTTSHRFQFNWPLAWPLLVMFGATAAGLGLTITGHVDPFRVGQPDAQEAAAFGLGWFWSAYNLVVLGLALLALIDVPRSRGAEGFNLRRTVNVQWQGFTALQQLAGVAPGACSVSNAARAEREQTGFLDGSVAVSDWQPNLAIATSVLDSSSPLWGMTTWISEDAAEIQFTQPGFPMVNPGAPIPVTVHLLEDRLALSGLAVYCRQDGEYPVVRIKFQSCSVQQQRRLIELLFCRPGQWKRVDAPGELRSLLYIVQALLRPRILFGRSRQASAISVHNG